MACLGVVAADHALCGLDNRLAQDKRRLGPACGRLFARYSSGLMSTPRYPFVHIKTTEEIAALLAAEAWDLGAAGIEERDHTTIDRAGQLGEDEGQVLLVISFSNFDDAEQALAHFEEHEPTLVVLEGDQWRDEWKKYFEPSRVSGRLCLQPPWKAWQGNADDVVLTIDPGRAFGTGLHETTRLVLKVIEASVRGGERVLDVGCGSGILAIAALKLGAASAVCVDNDPDVVPITLENATVNGVGDPLQASATPIEEVEGSYEHVYANIQAHILVPMADALRARVAPGGILVLSGILEEYADGVQEAFRPWHCAERHQDNEWVALVLREHVAADS